MSTVASNPASMLARRKLPGYSIRMTPSVGRIVHYVSYGTPGGEYPMACRAAVVTQLLYKHPNDAVGLAVLNPTGMFFNQGVERDDGETEPAIAMTAYEQPQPLLCGAYRRGGTWHWPERTPE